MTALFFFKFIFNFFKSLMEKLGLAASWIKTFLIFLFLINLSPFCEDWYLSFPPLIILIFLFFKDLIFLFDTIIISLNKFDLTALSIEWRNKGLFL